VSVQLHALANLQPGKEPKILLDMRQGYIDKSCGQLKGWSRSLYVPRNIKLACMGRVISQHRFFATSNHTET
jgi:hypothetical protein